ncbi:MAG: winged helix-turn-helix domain-containing protein [Chloroflexota bacterium]
MSNVANNAQGFRHEEVMQLTKFIEAGESASIIGMSGTGKSNLFNHLCDSKTQELYFTERPFPLIVRVNFHYAPDFTDRSMYSLILEQLEAISPREISRINLPMGIADQVIWYHDSLIEAKDDLLKVQRSFKQAIRLLLYGNERKLVFLFDQFDDVYREAPAHFFANLRGLRENYKYRISYLIFTRDMLPNIMESDPAREEFYELMASNLVGLRPYNFSDARDLLTRIGKRNQINFNHDQAEDMITVSGGHAGLLRATFLTSGREELNWQPGKNDESLLDIPGVRLECEKVWRSLSVQERKVLHTLQHGQKPSFENVPTLEQLSVKGVLRSIEDPKIFSPLFALFIKRQDPLWERPIYFEESTRQILVLGQPIPSLTSLEFRLFRALYERDGEVLDKDDLIEAGWPSARGGVSDEALTAAMARLRRKIEPDSKNPRFLNNIRNQGYTLKLE